jgi:hypothetical protein
VNDLSKYRISARRSGIAGIVICISGCVAILFYFGLFNNPILSYLIRLAQCLLVVLPIPAIVTGLWAIRGLNRKDHGQEIGYAVFGIISGILGIVAILLLIKYLAEHLV